MKTLNVRTVTAKELIEVLNELPEGARVAFSSDYGDYVHTEQLHLIRGETELVDVCESAYSHSQLAVERDDDEGHNFNPENQVYLIN